MARREMRPVTSRIAIFLVTCAALIALVFAKPSVMIGGKKISIFWLAPLGGALALMIGGYVSPSEIAAGLTAAGDVNPIKILLLFFSMTMMSVYLDEIGFFRLLAHKVLGKAKGFPIQTRCVYLNALSVWIPAGPAEETVWDLLWSAP